MNGSPLRVWLSAALLTALLGLTALVAAAIALPADPASGRAAGSTWSTAPAGWSGVYELLVQTGQSPHRYEAPLAAMLTPAADRGTEWEKVVLVLAHPSPAIDTRDQERLLAMVERGATLVLATSAPLALLESRGVSLTPQPLSGAALPALPSPLTRSPGELPGGGGAAARPVSGLAALYTNEHGIRVGATAAGDGQVVLLTDTELLSNQALRGETARSLAISLFPPDSQVHFLEGYHGFNRRRGLTVWLSRRGWGAWLLCALVIAGLAIWRRAARLGPPAPAAAPRPAGLTGLALAAGRLRRASGDHKQPLQAALDDARARGLRRHTALADAEAALRERSLSGERALALACALERAVRGSGPTASGAAANQETG